MLPLVTTVLTGDFSDPLFYFDLEYKTDYKINVATKHCIKIKVKGCQNKNMHLSFYMALKTLFKDRYIILDQESSTLLVG